MTKNTGTTPEELEDAFIRWESSGFKDLPTWLTHDKKGNKVRSYSGTLKNFGAQLGEPRAIAESIRDIKNKNTLTKYLSQAEGIDFPSGKDYALGMINEKIGILEGEARQVSFPAFTNMNKINEYEKQVSSVKQKYSDWDIPEINDKIESAEASLQELKERKVITDDLKVQFKREQLNDSARREAEEKLSNRSLGQLRRFENQRTENVFRSLDVPYKEE